MDEDFSALYEELFGRPLREPKSDDEVRDILNCIRTRNGHLDAEDDAQLQRSSALLHRKFKLFANNSRKILAQSTKIVSSQLYDDTFRFFYELIQNADDAIYHKAADENAPPCIDFKVQETQLIVDLNEDGFNLANVLAICSTGQSSKANNSETTGEKGFGFKAVFGIASNVHIQSGRWSFSFHHERDQDGIGMITPYWTQPNDMPSGIRTRFILTFAFEETSMLNDLCKRIRAQPVTIVSFLRRITKINLCLDNVLGKTWRSSVSLLSADKPGYSRISQVVDGEHRMHYFRGFEHTVNGLPARNGRTSTTSKTVIHFPVKDHDTCEPLIAADGQYLFAYLPIRQMAQLPFIIQADFMLPASRQDVIDNLWNRKLRDGIVKLFSVCMEAFARASNDDMKYLWLKYLPMSPMSEFWQTFLAQIRAELQPRQTVWSCTGTREMPTFLRLISDDCLHNGQPLILTPSLNYKLLSLGYAKTEEEALRFLGVRDLSVQDKIELIRACCGSGSGESPLIKQHSLEDGWHDSFLGLISRLLRMKRNQNDPDTRAELFNIRLLPTLAQKELTWKCPLQGSVYFPTLVNEKYDEKEIHLRIPADLDLVVIHPDAALRGSRNNVYELLGVRKCPKDVVCRAIENHQRVQGPMRKDNQITHAEILYWYSWIVTWNLCIPTDGPCYSCSTELFFQSDLPFNAEKVARLRDTDTKRESLVAFDLQNSQMKHLRRSNVTWLEWLQRTRNIRWFAPLEEKNNRNKLHWIIIFILESSPYDFIPMLQSHWVEEYCETFRSNLSISKALLNAKVKCLGEDKWLLKETWFPARSMIVHARKYGVVEHMGFLALPNSEDGASIEDWSSLRDMGINSGQGLNYYKCLLIAMAANVKEPPVTASLLELYEVIGAFATLQAEDEFKKIFREQKLIWDGKRKNWCSSSDCVWKSKVPLTQKFVIEGAYSGPGVQNLFERLLQIGNAGISDYIAELDALARVNAVTTGVDLMARSTELYKTLEVTAIFDDDQKDLRDIFKRRALIYYEGSWYKSSSCIWHESIDIDGYMPIKSSFTTLEQFFTTILKLKTVTVKFMMAELARAATTQSPDYSTVKQLMLKTSGMLNKDVDRNSISSSLDKLKVAKFLPCKKANGDLVCLPCNGAFHILDDTKYAAAFEGKLCVLDFTYPEFNTIYSLIELLELESHYLHRNVIHRTQEGNSSVHDQLTKQIRECAYAISCCAVYHHSHLYLNQQNEMHDTLRTIVVKTSPDMRTTLCVKDGDGEVEVVASKPSFILSHELNQMQIVMSQGPKEQRVFLRSQLPDKLAEKLAIGNSKSSKQIHRFINEIDVGTDEILHEEDIPHADWLCKTERVVEHPSPGRGIQPSFATPTSLATPTTSTVSITDDHIAVGGDEHQSAILVSTIENSVGYYQQQQRVFIPIPAQVDHRVEAPQYWRVLDHLRRQAVGVIWRGNSGDRTSTSTNDHIRYLTDLRNSRGNSVNSARYPEVFGSDPYVKHRIGAAGELFAFEILRSILGHRISPTNWQSTIRHYATALDVYSDLERWNEEETADLTYTDQDSELVRVLNTKTIGDRFDNWLPDCLSRDSQHSVPQKWFFEVKTTLGPCKTEFFMSQNQYSKMRSSWLGGGNRAEKVYCIIRVYDLLKETVGVRFYIDPWRFRDVRLDFNTTDKWRVSAV